MIRHHQQLRSEMRFLGHMRVAMVVMQNYVQPESANRSLLREDYRAGYRLMSSAMKMLRLQNYTYDWCNQPMRIGSLENGSYDGVIGMLERDEADFWPLPFRSNIPFDPITEGPKLASLDGIVISSLQYTVRDFDMTESLMTVSTGVTLALITSVIIAAFLLSEVQHRLTVSSVLKNFSHLCRLLLGQSDHKGKSWGNMMIMFSFGWAFFFFLMYWENLMSTDQVSIDRSLLINSLEDIVKNKTIRAMMTFEEPIANIFLTTNDSLSKDILRNHKNISGTKAPKMEEVGKFYNEIRRNLETGEYVVVASDLVGNALLNAICHWRYLFKADFWIGKNKFFPAYLIPYYSKNIEREKKEYLDFRYRQVAEHGVSLKFVQEFQMAVPRMFENTKTFREWIDMFTARPERTPTYSAACPVDNIEAYFQNQIEMKSKSAPNMINYKTVFAIFAVGLFISVLVALLEFNKRCISKCASRLGKARRRGLRQFRKLRKQRAARAIA